MECKTTSAKSYTLKLADLEKIKAEALMGGAEGWAFQVEFQGSTNKRFAVIDWQEFLDLRAAQKVANTDPFKFIDAEKAAKAGGSKPDEALSKEDCG